MQDLAVLTPSLIVCLAFLAGVFALLRHEMAPRRRDREDGGQAGDNTGPGSFSDAEDGGSSAASHHEDVMERQAGRRSSREA
jgi:hypothetical protein